MQRKRQAYIISSYMRESKNFPTEEYIRLSSALKIVDCLTGRELKCKSEVYYVLDTLVLDTVSFLRRMIHNECYETYLKIHLLDKKIATEKFLKVD